MILNQMLNSSRRPSRESSADVSPVVGLYAAPGALILYAAFGSSKHLITGPMAAESAEPDG
jgi:MFS superfamily sulfate permease-like transporter